MRDAQTFEHRHDSVWKVTFGPHPTTKFHVLPLEMTMEHTRHGAGIQAPLGSHECLSTGANLTDVVQSRGKGNLRTGQNPFLLLFLAVGTS